MNESFITKIGDNKLPVKVYFDYDPKEEKTDDYPGCAAFAEIKEVIVKVGGVERCISDILSEETIDLLGERAIEYVADQIAMNRG